MFHSKMRFIGSKPRQLLVGSVFTAMLHLPAICNAQAIEFSGMTKYPNGKPIVGGTILVTELKQRPLQMPVAKILTRAGSDRDGHYKFRIGSAKGDLHIELLGDNCEWLGGFVVIRKKDLAGPRTREVDLVSEAEACPTEVANCASTSE
ncbi:hypothetical protein [Tahibacter amnicola]|uniref:Carboxypeptidase family protein n=1 Tax=Tahibacter amnicola TaxID=2976241 RepID=A0ABY6BGZ0_9GAMM|nr:hypothetical protein [Tahibacter amnicola]UXI69291.1 hypothetical protein N4264_06480 [Tahibacter amnicola]